MLYLIKQYGKNTTYLKIGYTQNLQERLKAYNTHNAEFELVCSMEGDQELETFAHKLLLEYNIKGSYPSFTTFLNIFNNLRFSPASSLK